MNKYKIEGNIDFFAELYKSLDEEDNIDDDTNKCLITNQPLTDNFVQLQCGHKFNYVPLFLDVKNHKQKFNNLEGNATHLEMNEIRCPYCRHKHPGVLPYYEECGYGKINGVNDFNPNIKGSKYQGYNYKQCEYLTLNPHYDASGNKPMETAQGNAGNVKFFVCYLSGTPITNSQVAELNNGKCYCYKHKNAIVKEHNKKMKEIEIAEKKAQKLLEKAKAKEEKESAKKALQEEKAKAKAEKKLNKGKKMVTIHLTSEENVVISDKPLGDLGATDVNNATDVSVKPLGEINTILLPGCVEVLKSGANKGIPCGCKIVKDNLCKRHYNLKNK